MQYIFLFHHVSKANVFVPNLNLYDLLYHNRDVLHYPSYKGGLFPHFKPCFGKDRDGYLCLLCQNQHFLFWWSVV